MSGTGLLALLATQDEPDWLRMVLVLLFFALPALGGLLKKVFQTGGQGAEEGGPTSPLERRRLAREEQRRREEEGQDLWRRLARGEESAAERPAPPAAEPSPPPSPALARTGEEEGEPAPLAVLGEVSEPTEVSAASLEQETEPEPLGAMAGAQATEVAAEPARRPFRMRAGELRRAVVLSEILAPPLSLRGNG